ncbi:MAG: preprotein translocase subunit SecD [Nanoarchaeota archaeon]|nr:preprotein translocase subunit SecD [Nanoarchaeota archaeon]
MKFKVTFKIWVLIILVLLSLISIFGLPPKIFQEGVVISSIESNSSLFNQGLKQGQIIHYIDNKKISNIEDYSNIFSDRFPSDEEIKTIITTKSGEYIFFGKNFPEITVSSIPKTNIALGLDLKGGSRALIKAENKSLSSEEISDLIDITSNRLNAFGLTDLKVASVSDLAGNNFMLIEIAGATPKHLKKLISEQGKFEAKIGNETVFEGGSKDIASVSRDAQHSRIESCNPSEDGSYYCRFSFAITLSPEAAKKHADLTNQLSVNATQQGNYLSEKLDLILDGNQVDSLLISEGLKGQVTTQISISGSGSGPTEEDAYVAAKEDMKRLQTILMTGSLPYKLEILKLDTISPTLGKEFIRIIIFAGLFAILIVSIIIFIRYKNFKSSLALIATTISEIIIILGIASMIRWNLDLPSIAGILATMGTGIDDLIILLDESSHSLGLSLKHRLKRAFTIIMGAYFTTFVSLLPLLWAGAGLLKGFAITTIIGISVGVFITRPAFSEMVRQFKTE